MNCVSIVSYIILINGYPTFVFHLSRGLRQGDPLSLYLFLIDTEDLLAMIRKVKMRGYVHGVNMCKQVPVISHLFFFMTMFFSSRL